MAFTQDVQIKPRKRYSGSSRYTSCDQVIDGDITRLSFKRYKSDPKDVNRYKVGQVPHARISRPDLMSYVAYGTVALFWVLYYFNRSVCLSPFRFVQDKPIMLPHPSKIVSWVNQTNLS